VILRLCIAPIAIGLAILLGACGDDTTTIINQTTSTVATEPRTTTETEVSSAKRCLVKPNLAKVLIAPDAAPL
jgi:hypothetical protein